MLITCGPVQQDVIGLIDDAQRKLVLVSPFIELWPRLRTALERAATRGVQVTMITKGGAETEKQAGKLRPVRSALHYVGFVEGLHAKLYLNEESAILTSMNLVSGSALNSIEFSAFIQHEYAPKEYRQVKRICEELIKKAVADEQRAAAAEAEEAAAKRALPANGRVPKWGYCIRCIERIAFSVAKPLCDDCFASWNRYKKRDYAEPYCHKCGEEIQTCFRDPICTVCWVADDASVLSP